MSKKILIIGHSISFIKHTADLLLGYEVVSALSGKDGFRMVQTEKPDLVLLEVLLQDVNDLNLCRLLSESERTNFIPIILIASQDKTEEKVSGLKLGAIDCITKPFHSGELQNKVRNILTLLDRNKLANPLTGLKGNLEIHAELNRRINSGVLFAVIYADLDNFKSFNDVYGFVRGDYAIHMTADIILEQVDRHGQQDDFIGHIGGDDFIIITKPSNAELICKEIIHAFDQQTKILYKNDGTEPESSSLCYGQEDRTPLLSISMAIVTNEHHKFYTNLHLSEIAAKVKRRAKLVPGSSFMKN